MQSKIISGFKGIRKLSELKEKIGTVFLTALVFVFHGHLTYF
jgi:hypothetical protein